MRLLFILTFRPLNPMIPRSIGTPACSPPSRLAFSFFFYPRYYRAFRSVHCAAYHAAQFFVCCVGILFRQSVLLSSSLYYRCLVDTATNHMQGFICFCFILSLASRKKSHFWDHLGTFWTKPLHISKKSCNFARKIA